MKSFSNSRLAQFPPWLLALLCAVLALVAYAQALDYPFVGDDIGHVVSNTRLAGLHWYELWRLLQEPYNATFEYLPLRDFSFWIDIALFGQNPGGYRLHNILVYLLCLPLVYAVTAKLLCYFQPMEESKAPWIAAIVTALFAIHPALVESVVWISGRKYILPDFFSLLALWLAAGVRRKDGFSSRHAVATLAAFVAVMFSKSSYVGVAPAIAMLWWRFWLDLPPTLRRRSLLLWPAAILLLASFLLLVFVAHNSGFDTVPPYFGMEAITRLFAIQGGLGRLVITPEGRHFFYPLFDDPLFSFMVMLGAAVLAAAGWGVIVLLRRRSLCGFLLLMFLLLCLPYLQLVPAKPPSLIADRYVALAIWPAIMMIVVLVWKAKPPFRVFLLLCLALPWMYQTLERPRDWININTLAGIDWDAYPGYYAPADYHIRTIMLPRHLYAESYEEAKRIQAPEVRGAMLKLIHADEVLRVETMKTGNPQAAMSLLLELGYALEEYPPRVRWDTPMLLVWKRLESTLAGEWMLLARSFPNNALLRYNTGLFLMRMGSYRDAEINLRAASELNNVPVPLRDAIRESLDAVHTRQGIE